MNNLAYAVLVLVVALWSIFRGFRLGITRQLSSLLGLAFGSVCARVFTSQYCMYADKLVRGIAEPHYVGLVSNLVCAVCIFIIVFLLFNLTKGIFRRIMSVFHVGILNRMIGSFFCLVCNLLWLSIFFNLLICLRPDSGLMLYEKSDDGNMIAAVMAMTPAILGCRGAEDYAHEVQLREASTISRNYNESESVIIINDSQIAYSDL